MCVFLVKVDAMSHETASIIWPPITHSTGRSVDSILPPEIREVSLIIMNTASCRPYCTYMCMNRVERRGVESGGWVSVK